MKFRALILVGAVLFTWGSLARANVISPGFEQGPVAGTVSFSPTDANGLGWFASNTDGERIQSTGPKPAAEGSYYASLLQNAGAYDGSPLGVGDFGFTGFDRIYATFAVSTNTTYNVSFQHAGDDRFGYLANTSVVEIVDFGTNATITQQFFNTPGLFNWQMAAFQFNSGSATQAAIAFTVMGSGNTSGVFDDIQIAVAGSVPEPTTVLLLVLGLAGLAFARRKVWQ